MAKGKDKPRKEKKKPSKKTSTIQPNTVVSVILDKSGSMVSIAEPTIRGFNEYLKGLKSKKAPINFSLTLFDTESIEKRYIDIPIEEIPDLNMQTYRPMGGTPLYDAVVKTVEDLEDRIRHNHTQTNVVVVIMTDGQENSSKEHDEDCLRKLINRLQSQGDWTFTYLGANQDAWDQAQKIGIYKGNTRGWSATAQGANAAFADLGAATVNYVASSVASGGAGGSGMYQSKSFFDQKTNGQKDNQGGETS